MRTQHPRLLCWACLVLIPICLAAGQAAQVFTVDARSFRTDFRTLYECVERVGHESGLRVVYSGSGTGWDGGDLANQKETYEVEASKDKLPFLGDGPMSKIASLRGPHGLNAPTLKIKLDPDTGELRAPRGVDLKGLKLTNLTLNFITRGPEQGEPCAIEFHRAYTDAEIRVAISTKRKDGRAFCRDFMTSLESEMKLAKVKEAKKEGRQDEKPRVPIPDKKK